MFTYLSEVKQLLYLFTFLSLLWSCGSNKILQQIESEPQYQKGFSGFYLAEAKSKKLLAEFQSDKLFTPASNVKLLTFATALRWLPNDSLPVLVKENSGDTLRIWPLAYPDLAINNANYNQTIQSEIRDWKGPVEINLHKFRSLPRLGKGWMWDDYPYAFAREISGFPMYGNLVKAWRLPDTTIKRPNGSSYNRLRFQAEPDFFAIQTSDYISANRLSRKEFSNQFYASPQAPILDTLYAPIYTSYAIAPQLLEDWTSHSIKYHNQKIPKDWRSKTWKGEPRDSLLKRMMLPSDNFLAEHLLLMSGFYRSELTKTAKIIEKANAEIFKINEEEIAWVDGSGISHYNLISPRALGKVLHELADQYTVEYISNMLPQGGKSGTIKKWYAAENPEQAYVFAKTGTLKHNHALSGYLKAKSGKWLVFSFMHNHYKGGSTAYKKAMEKTLKLIYESY